VLKFGPEVLGNPEEAQKKEWLLADGLGGYASSTVLGMNTRRYHGLLVVAREPPVERMVLLSRVEETLVVGGQRFELGTNAYPGVLHPRGYEHATRFALDPLPSLTFEVGGGRLTRTVARIHREPTLVLVYLYSGEAKATLEVRPLLAYRDHHALQHENGALEWAAERRGEDLVFHPYASCPALFVRFAGADYREERLWYRDFEYGEERRRGLDFREDLSSPGVFTRALPPGEEVALVASTEPLLQARDGRVLLAAERKRMRLLGQSGEGLLGDLRRAADQFIVARGERGRTIIAGYPWFEDWGRDTMIALPGLCLATGRFQEARAILREFAGHVEGGLIPNRFPENGSPPEYNTVDAALWMVLAIGRYLETTRDTTFVLAKLRPAVEAILEGYRSGTRHGIRMAEDGLVEQGEPGLQLTWMDARVGSRVITPRAGKPVEIQALWYNALLVASSLASEAGDGHRAAFWSRHAALCRKSFQEAFWIPERGYLADCVSAAGRDEALRPNQLYAVGLPHALLARPEAESLLAATTDALLTPVGLRTLAPHDPAYHGTYEGGPAERDEAYHQGTVWPYLMGAYFDALIRIRGEAGKADARRWLQRFTEHLGTYGLNTVGEVFSGDPPHAPGGTISQAWSVAEVLRIETRLAGRSAAPPIEDAPRDL
jgi:predicted glycogen debranching enzyme